MLHLRLHWRLSTILKTSNKSVWSNVFWYVKACIIWKCIQYTIRWDKSQMLKKIHSGQNIRTFVFLKLCLGFSLWVRFAFIKDYIFVQQNAWTLKRHNSFQNQNNKKATDSVASRPLIFKLQQEVWKFNEICISRRSPKTDLTTNFLNLENRSLENVSFSQ